MGFNLAAGLAAADEYYREGDRRVLRDRAAKRFDWEDKRAQSEMSLLDDKTAAERSGYQNTRGANEAAATLRPGATANAQRQQKITAGSLDGAANRQPMEEQTKDINAGVALSDARNTQAQQPTKQAMGNDALNVQAQTTKAQLEQLPEKLRQARVQGVLDERGQADVVVGTLGKLLASNDKAGVLAFANKIAATGDLLPGTNGMKFSDVQLVQKGEDPAAPNGGYRFVSESGALKTLPVELVRDAMGKMASGKYKFIERDDGSIFAGNENTGAGKLVQGGDPAITAKGGKGGQTPAEIQTMNWLIDKGVAKSPQDAWDRVRSAREKTRTSFVADYVAKNAMPGQDANAVAKQAGEIYDNLKLDGAGMSNTQSNTGKPAKLDAETSSWID